MNVLILTPDAVGSTLLQRLITIYMQFHVYDRPVINLHELTNGLEKYYSPEFNREILSKKKVQNWTYYQTLEQIVDLLSSVDHYKTSRLAQYHINSRKDPLQQQIPFYQYLDDNFFVISCRRHNIFEHAVSMSLNKITKKLNVYSHAEKISSFIDIYAEGTWIDQRVFENQLECYKQYIDWSERHFNIGSYFYYDEHVENIEKYILNLPMFDGQQQKITWQEKFNIDFDDWNRCHHIPSDLGSITSTRLKEIQYFDTENSLSDTYMLNLYQKIALPEWPAVSNESDMNTLPENIKTRFTSMILDHKCHQELLRKNNNEIGKFLRKNNAGYKAANEAIKRMQELDIIITPPPIKKQTLKEKMQIVKNFDQCLDSYNNWICQHPSLGKPLSDIDFENMIEKETQFWSPVRPKVVESDQQSNVKLEHQNDNNL